MKIISVPSATEGTPGIAPFATIAETIAGVLDTKTITPLKTKATMDNVSTVLYDTTTEITGESLVVGDSFFKEAGITFANATSSQRIGENISSNARVTGAVIGSGVSGSTLKLSLSKTGTPTQNLNIRIETDNAGKPSGTLVDPNATGTVTQASLTTSLADTTITLGGTITLTKGTKYHILCFQGVYGTETISSSNYYNIGYSTNNTLLRGSTLYDGVPTVTDSNGIPYDTSFTTTFQSGVRITANFNTTISSVTKTPLSTATRCQIFTDGGSLLATATFVGDIATLGTPLAITSGVTYRVLADNNGASYNWRSKGSASFPFVGTGVTTIGGYYSGNTTTAYNIAAVSTTGTGYGSYNPAIQFYTSSTLIEDVLLMKTDATYSYKLPTDFPRISRQIAAMGSTVMFDFGGVSKQFTGLSNTTYYLANTPGLISTSAGTNIYIVGQGNSATNLEIDGKNLNKPITVTASPFSYVNTTGGPIQVKITGGTVNPIVINGVTTATATNHINTLPAGATMTVTYTVLPTIVYSDL